MKNLRLPALLLALLLGFFACKKDDNITKSALAKFTDFCHQGRTEFRGTPRSFNSFIDMSVEDAYSRIPLGVHFRMDCDEGLRLGYLAGQRVLELPWKK